MEEGLIGAIIGGLLTAGAQMLSEFLRTGGTKRNLAVALAAEAAAVAEVVRRREWLVQIVDYAKEAKTGHVYRFSVHLPDELITCSRAAAAQAGLLPGRLPSLVSRFVMLADGAAADIRRLANYPIDDERGFLRSDAPDDAEKVYSELLAVLVETLWTCDMIVLEAKEHYPKQAKAISGGAPSLIEEITRAHLRKKPD